jgi:hypothetical protein
MHIGQIITNLYIVPSNYQAHYHNMFDTLKPFVLYDHESLMPSKFYEDHESLMPSKSYKDHESLMPTNPYGNIWKSVNFHYNFLKL